MRLFKSMIVLFVIGGFMLSISYGQDHLSKAGKYFFLKDYQNAVKEYKLALAEKPNDGRIYYNLGACYELLNEPIQAKSAYEKAVELQPDLKEAKEALDRLSSNTQIISNLKVSEALLRANNAYLSKDYQAAISEYWQVVRLAPNNFQALYNLASCYEQIEDYKNALQTYEKALEQNRTAGEVQKAVVRVKQLYNDYLIKTYKSQADSLLNLNQLNQAEKKVRQIFTINPDDRWASRKLQTIQARIEDEKKLISARANEVAKQEADSTARLAANQTPKKEDQRSEKTAENNEEPLSSNLNLILIIGGIVVIILIVVFLLVFRKGQSNETLQHPVSTTIPTSDENPPIESFSQQSVYDVIQEHYNSKKTGIIRVKGKSADGKEVEGEVRLFNGNIVDSNSNIEQGVAALYKLLQVENPTILSFQKIQVTDSGNIQQATLPLLMQWTLGMNKE